MVGLLDSLANRLPNFCSGIAFTTIKHLLRSEKANASAIVAASLRPLPLRYVRCDPVASVASVATSLRPLRPRCVRCDFVASVAVKTAARATISCEQNV